MCKQALTVCLSLGLLFALVQPASADLVGHWSFDDGAGIIAVDSSGNGHDAVVEGGGDSAWVEGQLGDAVEVGNGVWVNVPPEVWAPIDNQFTVAYWSFGYDGLANNWGFFATAAGANRMISNHLPWGDGSVYYDTADAAGAWQAERISQALDPGLATGVWNHWAFTKNTETGEKKIYLDGEVWLTGTNATGPVTEISVFTIGSGANGVQQYLGVIDDFQLHDVELTQEEIQAAMLGRGPELAADPIPEGEAVDVSRDVVLAWSPGDFAVTHDVYFGTTFGDVNDAAAGNPLGVLASEGQDATTFDPGRLEFSQTYFWRVDEVNGAPDFAVFGGDVWSFTVEPFSVPISNITATASSSFGASGAERTIDGSGLVDDLHGVDAAEMWISAGIPATLEYTFDRAYKLHELWIWNSNQLIETFVGFGAKDVVVEYTVDGENWTVLEGVGPLAQAPGLPGYAHNSTIDFGGAVAQQVRLTVNSVQGIAPQASLSEVRFYAIPTIASGPTPDSGATDVSPDTSLSWSRNGREAGSHEVFIGTGPASLVSAGATNDSSLDTQALDLQLGQTYHWRVDENNDVMDPSTWEGIVWNFTTADTIPIDDMESYKDEEFFEIWATWVDGFDDPANGSLVGGAAGIPETGIVQGGSQSLPMDYGIGGAAQSEATRTFDQTQDWTRSGIQSLVLYFKRGVDNTGGGQVYVKINDTMIVYEAAAGLPPGWDAWTQWTIDLSTVANAASVRSLTIGVEGAGATGVLYVDSIQLFKNAPTASEPLSWFEAESGTLTAPMQVFSDSPTASAGQHIGTAEGIGDENDNPPANGVATYSFDVPEDGVYRLAIRVSISGGSNSFWFRILGMVTNTGNHASGWVRFNDIPDGAAWHWDEVRSSEDGLTAVEFTLSAGTHTLEVAQREDGALLDAIAVLK